ncbi:MAG: glycerophosphodiester phosphodiesterase family protein [Microbacteriaceae bacterium]
MPTVSRFLAGPRPRVIAHRGFSPPGSGIVENTLPAFEAALAAGAQIIETDVRASRDGVAVIGHDPDLSRLGGDARRLADLDHAELAGAGIVSLSEALEALPEARFNIDIKSADAAVPAARAIRAAGAVDRVLVASFSDARRRAALALLPGALTSASAVSFATAFVAGRLGLAGLLGRALRGCAAVQVPERALGANVPTPRLVRRLHEHGVEVHVWTIDDAAAMHRLLDAGVDGIVTNRTDVAIEVLQSRRAL